MKTNLAWRLGIIAVVVVVSLFYAWPRAARPFFNMNLGLDLKGGSRIVVEVQTPDAVKGEADVQANRAGERLKKEGFPTVRVSSEDGGRVLIAGIDNTRRDAAQKIVQEELGTWSISNEADGFSAVMPLNQQADVKDRAVLQALETIRNRVDVFGVGETNVTRLGGESKNRILIEMPGVEDPSRIKSNLQMQAQLELRLAHEGAQGPIIANTREEVLAALGGQEPFGVEILPYEETNRQTLAESTKYMAVQKSAIVTGSDLQTAQSSLDEWQQPAVHFELRVNAVDRFAKFTRDNIDRLLCVVLDRRVKSYATIRSEIGRSGQISGSFTPQYARDLSLVLRSGALPARVLTIEERTVGPSLGKDSISAGLKASGVGALLVIVFMVLYYRLSGINAVVALALNLLILAGAMASVGAALTLPGIGGYALTVGMAVDANVLIFERIREELRGGRTVRAAIDAGFSKAFGTIADSNLTTIIAALFLIGYGTGPVKGFAVSLTIGLLANMFTAVFVSRTLYDLVLGNKPAQKLSI